MKILIVGSGGREHAIAASVANPRADKIYCAPGNAGIAEYAECVDIGAMNLKNWQNLPKKKRSIFASSEWMIRLVGGLVDVLEDAGIRTF